MVRFVILLYVSENITGSFSAVFLHSITFKDKIFKIIVKASSEYIGKNDWKMAERGTPGLHSSTKTTNKLAKTTKNHFCRTLKCSQKLKQGKD